MGVTRKDGDETSLGNTQGSVVFVVTCFSISKTQKWRGGDFLSIMVEAAQGSDEVQHCHNHLSFEMNVVTE